MVVKNLTAIKLPSSLKTINEAAFYNCSLKEIKIPKNVLCICKDTFK